MGMRVGVLCSMILMSGLISHCLASEFQSPRVAALGGAGRASPLSTDATFINPSFIPQIPLHVISVNYLLYQGQGGDYFQDTGRILNAAFQDGSKGAYFQAGVGYTKFSRGSMIHTAIATELSPNLTLGLSVKALRPQYEGNNLRFNGSLSMTWNLAKALRIAVIADNVLKSAASQNLIRELILGTRVGFSEDLALFVDPHWYPDLGSYPQSFGLESGVEWFVSNVVCLRAGGYKNARPNFQSQLANGVAAGLGFVLPRTAIDYSYSRQLSQKNQGFAHNVAISLYF